MTSSLLSKSCTQHVRTNCIITVLNTSQILPYTLNFLKVSRSVKISSYLNWIKISIYESRGYSTREIISIYCASLLATDLLLGLNTRKKLVPSTITNHLKPEFRFPANESKSRITLLRNFMLHVLTILYWVQNRKCPVFFMLRIYQLRNSRTPRLSD